MRPDSLLRRVRWGNVARLLALPAVVALVVLWPRLSPAPPRLPGAEPAPVAGPAEAAERGTTRAPARDDAGRATAEQAARPRARSGGQQGGGGRSGRGDVQRHSKQSRRGTSRSRGEQAGDARRRRGTRGPPPGPPPGPTKGRAGAKGPPRGERR